MNTAIKIAQMLSLPLTLFWIYASVVAVVRHDDVNPGSAFTAVVTATGCLLVIASIQRKGERNEKADDNFLDLRLGGDRSRSELQPTARWR